MPVAPKHLKQESPVTRALRWLTGSKSGDGSTSTKSSGRSGDAHGVTVQEPPQAFEHGGNMTRWGHGTCSGLALKNCVIPEANIIAGRDDGADRDCLALRPRVLFLSTYLDLGFF